MPSLQSEQALAEAWKDDGLEPMAIVGMSCRFPGQASSPQGFYDMLIKGRSAWSEIPKDRFNIDAYYHPYNARSGTMSTKGAHFLTQDPASFDAPFFSMSSAEAVATDPQLRILLEVAFESLDSAGVPLEQLVGSKTSCFVGTSSADYNAVAGRDIDDVPLYQAIGGGNAMLSNRISHFFDLRGHSMTLDTACSSGLIALHLGCQSIRAGESRVSLIGASQLMLIPDMMTSLSSLQFLGPEGRCFTFDERASGYSRGEGCSMIVIKSLKDALHDGDTIRAVIRGTGTNQDGKTPSIVQPSSEAQADLIRATYERAGLDYSKTQYFEAHGTGTPLGDPLEMSAVGATLGSLPRESGGPLYVGSVKTNIGHLEGCAGLAGLMKTILCLENAVIVPSINYERPNPRLRMDEWGLEVASKLIPWPTNGLRRASINSFGYGGSNAHCILDDAYHYLKLRGIQGNTNSVKTSALSSPESDEETDSGLGSATSSPLESSLDYFPSGTDQHPRLFLFSAHEQSVLQTLVKSYGEYTSSKSKKEAVLEDRFLANLAFTLGDRRSAFPWRAPVVSSSKADLGSALVQKIKGNRAGKGPKTAFIFTGQGAQWHAMGRELLAYDVFSRTVEEADNYLSSLGADWSVLKELNASEQDSRISMAKLSQPLCAVLQIALVNLLNHWGVKPTTVIGHSSGEIAAAYAAGALSAKDCFKIAYHRGRLSDAIKDLAPELKGSMMAVGLSEQDVQPYLDKLEPSDTAVVACVNSPSNVTISGDSASIDKLADLLKPEGVFARRLKVENAYHSPHMRTIADEYLASVQDIKTLHPESGPTMISSVTGSIVASSDLDAAYWVRNMVSPVQFLKAIEVVSSAAPTGFRRRRRDGKTVDTFLEVGPHSALQGPLKQILTANNNAETTTYLSLLHRGQHAITTSLEAIGRLWAMGQSLDVLRANSFEADPEPLVLLTDLPGYTWNHSHKFWHECSLSLNHRFKKTPRLDILGKRAEDFNPLEPRWTNTIRLSELPWLADHKIQGDILFPGAGMICAALEGIQQIADESKTVHSFELRDISIKRALVIPTEGEDIKLMLHMKPRINGNKAMEMLWFEFTVFSLTKDGEHTEHCTGLIRTRYVPEDDADEETAEDDAIWNRIKEEYADCQRSCTKDIKPRDFYTKWHAYGMQFGPLFQAITEIKSDGDNAGCSKVAIKDTKAAMPAQFEYDHLLHPITLDSMFQTFIAAITGSNKSLLPTSIDSLTVSARLPKGPGAEFSGFTKTSRTGFREFSGSVVMSDDSWNEPKIVIKGLTGTEVGAMVDGITSNKQQSSLRKMCAELVWKEDIDHVHQSEAEQLLQTADQVSNEHVAVYEKAVAIYIRRALSTLTPEQEAKLGPHLSRYVQWMRQQTSGSEQPDQLDESVESEDKFLAETADTSLEGRLICSIGKKLPDILSGVTPPLPILMEDNMLFNYHLGDPTNGKVLKWLDLQGHKRPDFKILEVGAGTGSMTLPALETLGGRYGSTPRFSQYYFTDSDPNCLESAQGLLKDWQSHIEFKKLNIESDPVDQGFEEESFDMIIAANVFHETRSLDAALSNCHKLLRPGGRIVLSNFTNPLKWISFVFGTLPSWWLSEDGRVGSPLIGEDTWHEHLLESQFSGLDVVIKDTSDGRAHRSSMMVSTKPSPITIPFKDVVMIDAPNPSEAVKAMSSNIQRKLEELGLTVEHATLEEAATPDAKGKPLVSKKAVVSLLEAESPLVSNMSEANFHPLKKALLNCLGGLWISRAGRQVDPSGDPAFCATTGLLRVFRIEKPDIRLHELNFSSQMDISSEAASDLVGRVFKSICNHNFLNLESEFSELDGRLQIPRLFDEPHKNHSLQTLGHQVLPELQSYLQPDRPLKLDIGVPGMLDTLRFIDDPRPLKPLAADEVEIEIVANALNFFDIMISMGLVPNTVLGLDAAGTIKRVGPKVTLVKPGDRVATFCPGAFKNLLRTHETLVQRLPEDMTFEDGASLPCIYITAYQSLIEVGRLSQGESVLIHSATGGLGQAAIQICKYLGATIFATAGSEEKRRFLTEELGIPSDHVFNSRDLSFTKGILRLTHGKGVDVILNSLSGEALRKTWECIATYGRFIEVGKKDILSNNGLDMKPFLTNAIFASVNAEHMAVHNPKLLARIFGSVFDLIRDHAIGPVPVKTFKFSEVELAFRFMQQAKHIGKIVLEAHADDMVPVIPRNPHPLALDKNATYLLVGGLGGIGRALATYLVEHGAKNLAFISRSGDSRAEAKEAINEIKKLGCNAIAYSCDAADAGALKTTFAKLTAEMPRLKGIIQAAMVLNDYYFEDMEYQQWIDSTRPKIQGSWNLHEVAPKDLDFFVMLSSISGISGNGAQSNYAAGNTFQDGLAHYRKSLGLTACALDLGAISGVGWLAENANFDNQYKSDWDRISLTPSELFSLIESSLTGYSEGEYRFPTQMVTGMGTGGIGQQMEHLKTSSAFDDPKYHYLRRLDVKGVVQSVEDTLSELKTALTASTSLAHAAELVEGALAFKLSKSLSMPVEDIDTSRAIHSYGVDSLVAIEMRNWIFKELKSQVSVFDVQSKVPITQFAIKIAKKSGYVPPEALKEGGAEGGESAEAANDKAQDGH